MTSHSVRRLTAWPLVGAFTSEQVASATQGPARFTWGLTRSRSRGTWRCVQLEVCSEGVNVCVVCVQVCV